MSSPVLAMVASMATASTPAAGTATTRPATLQPAGTLTAKGVQTKDRIVAAAAQLIHQHGLAGTTVDNVRVAAEVSGSQLYHYFTDKDALVRAVIDSQAQRIVDGQQHVLTETPEGLRSWRDAIVAQAHRTSGEGGCPLGSLAGQLAESDPAARAHLAAGFQQWSDTLTHSLQSMQANGRLPDDVPPADLAVTLLATLQGGLLLAQVNRDTAPLETALNTLIALTNPT